MSFVKKVVKTAAGAGIAYLALGEIAFEGALNLKFSAAVRQAMPALNAVAKGEAPIEEKFYNEGSEWYDARSAGDTVLHSFRLRKTIYSKVYFADEKSDKWAICCHGYSSCPRGMASFAKVYNSMGFNVILPHMIGHGSDESTFVSMGVYDKLAILDWIDYILDLNKDAKIVLHGVSMGAVTILLASGEDLPDNVVSIVSDCAYTDAWEMFSVKLKEVFRLPAFPILYAANTASKLHGNFDFKDSSPIKTVVHSKTPTLFIHGENDNFVPFAMMVPLYEACCAPDKDMLSVPNAPHGISVEYETEMYWNKVREFIGKYIDVK